MNEEELKKGCGKETDYFNYIDCNDNEIFWKCGEEGEFIKVKVLCPTCQARLEGFQKGKLEERKRIRQLLGFFQSNMKVINEDTAQIRISDWEELKQQLQKEIGGKEK